MKKRILSCVMASYLFCGLGLVQAEQTEETQRDRAYHGYGDETQKSQGRKKFKKQRFADLDLNGDTYKNFGRICRPKNCTIFRIS